MYTPTVSVIINTYNRGAHLKRLLDALSRQTYDNFEVIVVNGPSTDNIKEIIRQYKRAIRTAKCPVTNLSVSRNIGVRKAAGEIIAFIDDDAVPQDTKWIETAVSHFQNRNVGIVGGAVYQLGGNLLFQYGWFDIWGQNNGLQNNLVVYNDPKGEKFSCGPGCNVFFRRKAIVEAGGFDEYYAYYLDESDLGMRIIQKGYKCQFGEHMAVVHEIALGPFRRTEYHENWFVTGKSHGYFVLKATENTNKTRKEREEIARCSAERQTDTLKRRLEQHLISQEEYIELTEALKNGVEQGIRDAENKERQLDYSIRPRKTVFKKYDKTIFLKHQSICILCESPKEEIQEDIKLLSKELSEKGHNVYVVSPGIRTKLNLKDGVNYCTVNFDQQDEQQIDLHHGRKDFYNSYAVFYILQELRQIFDVRMVITPIRAKPIYSECILTTEQLFITGDAIKTEEKIRLRKTGFQYGPYITLKEGIYEVEYAGNNLQKIDEYFVATDFGKRRIHHDMIEKTDCKVRYSFSIDEQTAYIEFAAINQDEATVEITGIVLRQIMTNR